MKFSELLVKSGALKPPHKMVALDPGETVGWAEFVDGELKNCGQLVTKQEVGSLISLLKQLRPEVIVFEDYKIYPWKLKEHSWSSLFTPQLIGAIKLYCSMEKIPYFTNMAGSAKGFCTDAKLKEWGYFQKWQKHARDAIRHGCFWLLCRKERKR